MKFLLRYLLIIMIIAGCKKNNVADSSEVKYDSVSSQFVKTYYIDLNRDNTNDIAIEWSHAPLQQDIVTYKVWSLTSNTSIHTLEQLYPICKDTTHFQSYWTTLEKNCTLITNPVRIDTMVSTPNLELSSLSATAIHTHPGDSFFVYKKVTSLQMPSQNANSIDIEYGFFKGTNSGYLLFELNGKRHGLLIRRDPAPLYLEKVVQVDP